MVVLAFLSCIARRWIVRHLLPGLLELYSCVLRAETASFKGGPYSHGCHAPQSSVGAWMKRVLTFGAWNPDTSQFSVLDVTNTGGDLHAANTNICFKAYVIHQSAVYTPGS